MRLLTLIGNGRTVSRLRCGILALFGLVTCTVFGADVGEAIPLPASPTSYIFVPGKLTGQEFYMEKENIRCKIFSFDQFRNFPKPKDAATIRLSLRGGYRAHDIFGNDDFTPKEARDVATGWVPQANGNFLIFPDLTKQHLPRWIPKRTRLLRVPLIKLYGDKIVNAYDLPLALDRFANGDLKSIEFQLAPAADDNGKQGVRLTPASPLTDGVYYAYSLPDDRDSENYGFLFAVGNPDSKPIDENVLGPDFSQAAYRQDNPFWRSGQAPKSTAPPNAQLGNALGNCTWYANGRLRELGYNKDDLDKLIRDASKWDDIARSYEIPISKLPTKGSIAQTDSGAGGMGHVAVVENVNIDDTITISESSFAGNNPSAESKWNFIYRERTVSPSIFQNFIQVRKSNADGNLAGNSPDANTIQPQPTKAPGGIQPADAQLASEVLAYAKLSQAVYDLGSAKFKAPDGWKVVPSKDGKAFFENRETGFKVATFTKGTILAIVFQGTNPKEWVDWKTDALALKGKKPEQYEEALDYVREVTVQDATHYYNIVMTGHSLGGGLATYAALYYKIPAIVFNAAPMGEDMLSRINLNERKWLVKNIDMKGDPVSGLGGQIGPIYTLEVPVGVIAQLSAEDKVVEESKRGLPIIRLFQTLGAELGSTYDTVIELHSIDNIVFALLTFPANKK